MIGGMALKLFQIFMIALMALFLVACGLGDTKAIEEPLKPSLVELWTEDIEQFRTHVVRWHPRFANNTINRLQENLDIREAFDNSLDMLLENLDDMSEFDIYVELQRTVSLLKDNHFFFTGFAGYDAGLRVTRYPAQFAYLSDGVYIIRTNADNASILNSRLVAIGGVNVYEALERFTAFWSVENKYDARYQFALMLNSASVLRAIGLSDGESVTYSFENGESITLSQTEQWERLFTTLRWLPPASLVDNRAEGETPLFLQYFRQNLWHEFNEENGILYISIRGWVPDVQGTFARAVRNTFDNNDIKAVIIDARSNPGGDANQFTNLFVHMAHNLPEGRLFYFVNEGSNSGSLGAAYALENMGAVIVGQPLAQNSTFFWFGSSQSVLRLENSRMEITPPPTLFSALQFYQREPADGIFRPHVLLEYTIDDWVNNYDPFFKYVLSQLEQD